MGCNTKDTLTAFMMLDVTIHFNGKKQHAHSTEESDSDFKITWGWVNEPKIKNLPLTILLSQTKRHIKKNHHGNMSKDVSQSTQTNQKQLTALYVTKTTSQQQQQHHAHEITVYFYLLFPPKHSWARKHPVCISALTGPDALSNA